jgi:hypothetical protein
MPHRRFLLSLLLLAACARDGGGTDPALRDVGHFEVLDPPARLARASIALRGVRPDLADLQRVQADPDALPDLVDGYLRGPAFSENIRHMHGEWLITDISGDYFPAGFPALGPLRGVDANAINVAVLSGPARLGEHIVTEDLSYKTMLSADFTMADGIVAAVWGLPYTGTGAGDWQPTPWGDGRPAVGLLAESWWYVRHPSTDTNRQRARAAHLARALLCHDTMNREVRIPDDVDLTAGGANAIEENPACAACHQTLDPLGSALSDHEGVVVPQALWGYPVRTYDPGVGTVGAEPGFYGRPVEDVEELAAHIADDPRFARCAVQRFSGQLLAQHADDVPPGFVDTLIPAFVASDLQVRPLLRTIALSEAFAATGPSDAVPWGGGIEGTRKLTPWQLAQVVEALTGFRWTTRIDVDLGIGTVGEVDLMDESTFGFRRLAGGPDGQDQWDPMRTTDPTTVLVARGLAAGAAKHVVSTDLGAPADLRRLITRDRAQAGEESAVRAELADLHLRLFSEVVAPDSAAVDETFALFELGLQGGDVAGAWELVLFAMLQDPQLLHY